MAYVSGSGMGDTVLPMNEVDKAPQSLITESIRNERSNRFVSLGANAPNEKTGIKQLVEFRVSGGSRGSGGSVGRYN